jgi:hypothetical protein
MNLVFISMPGKESTLKYINPDKTAQGEGRKFVIAVSAQNLQP